MGELFQGEPLLLGGLPPQLERQLQGARRPATERSFRPRAVPQAAVGIMAGRAGLAVRAPQTARPLALVEVEEDRGLRQEVLVVGAVMGMK